MASEGNAPADTSISPQPVDEAGPEGLGPQGQKGAAEDILARNPLGQVECGDEDGEGGKDSGGWVFRRFMGDNWSEDVLKAEERGRCFKCHARRKSEDYVFSVYRK